MKPLIDLELGRPPGGLVARVAHSTRGDGDLSPAAVGADELAARRRRALDLPWAALRQVHSDRVVVVDEPGPSRPVGDALVTRRPRVALAVHSGDCVPIALVATGGAIAAAHGGWKGLEAGVLESTVRRLRALAGSSPIVAAVGPHIRADQYEFGEADLERLCRRFDDRVIATDVTGSPALDLAAAVAHECDRLDVEIVASSPSCTALDAADFWSHRARSESGRIALVAWLEPTASTASTQPTEPIDSTREQR